MLNEGIFGISYGAVLNATRRLFKIGQGSSQVMGEAIVLGASDITGSTAASKGAAAPGTNVPHFVVQVPYSAGAANAAITGAAPICLQVPDGGLAGGNVRGVGAVDLQSTRSAAAQVASGASSFIAGGTSNAASSFAAFCSGQSGSASGQRSFVAGGFGNVASNTDAVVAGNLSIASGAQSVAMGAACAAPSAYGVALGDGANANGTGATALQRATARGIDYSFQYGPPGRAAVGDRQIRGLPQAAVTTNATPTTLTTTGAAEATYNTWVLPNNYTGIFSGWIVARNTANNDSKGWRFEGMVSRDASAATVALLGSVTPTAVGTADASMSAVTLAVTVNTTNGSLIVQGTGIAATTIAWSGWIDCNENG